MLTLPAVRFVPLMLALALSPVARTEARHRPFDPAPCSTAEHRAFDFWLGDWDSYDPRGHLQGHLSVRKSYNGCVLIEIWKGTQGDEGTSFNIYDASRKVWNETWVSNHGTLLVLEGNRAGNQMTMVGTHIDTDGRPQLHRNIWTPSPTGVHQVWQYSTDGGQTWKLMYDGDLRPSRRQPR